jgi:hypothetical protein
MHSQSKPIASANPLMPVPLRVAIGLSCLLLAIVGTLLFFIPAVGAEYWIWVLNPAKAPMLGSIYLSALAPMALAAWINRWSPVRLVIVMLAVFTTSNLAISAFNLAQLSPRAMTKLWFIFYGIDSALALYYVWRYRNRPVSDPIQLTPPWTVYLRSQTLVLGLYGLGLLMIPTPLTSFWPWPIRPFHGRFYSSIFLAGAAGSGLLSVATSPLELLALGLSQLLFGGLEVLGLVMTDLTLGGIELPKVWLWVSALIGVAIAGVAMIMQSRLLCHRHRG